MKIIILGFFGVVSTITGLVMGILCNIKRRENLAFQDLGYIPDTSFVSFYTNDVEDYKKESQVLLDAIAKFWRENEKDIPKYNKSDGWKFRWKIRATRSFRYDEISGKRILGPIEFDFTHDAGHYYYTYNPQTKKINHKSYPTRRP